MVFHPAAISRDGCSTTGRLLSDRPGFLKLGGGSLLDFRDDCSCHCDVPVAELRSFGFKTSTALWFGAVAILFMDLSSNMSMQPFKMMISDMVNDEQKDQAWSWQTIWGNIGSVAADLFPFFLTWIGVKNIAAKGELPDSVKWSFYIGAAILVVSSIFTIWKVDEYDPETYAKYHGLDQNANISENFVTIVKHAPKVFWTLGIVEFFSWTGFQYLWTYGAGTVAQNIWHTTNASSAAYQAAGNWFGVLSAVEVGVAIIYGLVLQKLNDRIRKPAYALGMVLGALGFWGLSVAPTKLLSFVAFIGIGMCWVTINSIPFTILTNALMVSMMVLTWGYSTAGSASHRLLLLFAPLLFIRYWATTCHTCCS